MVVCSLVLLSDLGVSSSSSSSESEYEVNISSLTPRIMVEALLILSSRYKDFWDEFFKPLRVLASEARLSILSRS